MKISDYEENWVLYYNGRCCDSSSSLSITQGNILVALDPTQLSRIHRDLFLY